MGASDTSKFSVDQTKSNDDRQNIERIQLEMGNVIAQAQALSAMTWGEPGEVFRSQSDAIQENFMWTLNSLIDRIASMHRNLEERAINSGPTS